jgi:hypothetical protein
MSALLSHNFFVDDDVIWRENEMENMKIEIKIKVEIRIREIVVKIRDKCVVLKREVLRLGIMLRTVIKGSVEAIQYLI